MNKAAWVILIIVCAIIVVLSAVFVHIRFIMKNQIVDGPGSIYTWTDYELYTTWVEIGTSDGSDPVELLFDANAFTLKTAETENTYRYSLPEGVDFCGKPEGEVYLQLSECGEFENLIFHEELLESGEIIPVLSGTLFEYDGRGEIVFVEYVRETDLAKLPADFRSTSCIKRNDAKPVSMVKPKKWTSR